MGGYNPTQGLCRNLGLVAAELVTTSISRGKKISFKNPAEGLVELSSLIGTVTFGGRSQPTLRQGESDNKPSDLALPLPSSLRSLCCSPLSGSNRKAQGQDPVSLTFAGHLRSVQSGPGGADKDNHAQKIRFSTVTRSHENTDLSAPKCYIICITTFMHIFYNA